jgi:plastocyanin
MDLKTHGRCRAHVAPSRLAIAICLALAGVSGVSFGASTDTDVEGRALVGGRPVANAVVWLEAPDAPAPATSKKVVLDQRNLAFEPQVLAIRAGTTVLFPNNDRVFHNVFSFHHGTVFDLGLYPVGDSKVVRFEKAGISRIFCNIHPKMAAYIVVVDSPYFAVSDSAGVFSLPNVPAGRYTFHGWRSGSPDVTGVWKVPAPGERAGAMIVEWPK